MREKEKSYITSTHVVHPPLPLLLPSTSLFPLFSPQRRQINVDLPKRRLPGLEMRRSSPAKFKMPPVKKRSCFPLGTLAAYFMRTFGCVDITYALSSIPIAAFMCDGDTLGQRQNVSRCFFLLSMIESRNSPPPIGFFKTLCPERDRWLVLTSPK